MMAPKVKNDSRAHTKVKNDPAKAKTSGACWAPWLKPKTIAATAILAPMALQFRGLFVVHTLHASPTIESLREANKPTLVPNKGFSLKPVISFSIV